MYWKARYHKTKTKQEVRTAIIVEHFVSLMAGGKGAKNWEVILPNRAEVSAKATAHLNHSH